MTDEIRKDIEKQTEAARGGDGRDSQGDGVADAAAEATDNTEGSDNADAADDSDAAGSSNHEKEPSPPGRHRDAVPHGLERSILKDEDARR